jgi:hypothetical protein
VVVVAKKSSLAGWLAGWPTGLFVVASLID